KDVSMDELVEKTEGYVGADIESVCREAAIMALRESFTAKEVKLKHFEEALKKVAPSVTKEVEETYYELQKVVAQARAKEIKQEKPGYMV
ncbi:AAA family ATPase, partial [Candidatus Woesearchaeota archaeon]|nr:AAA family ATPase [Candidatus Woesearchaeota archaeon]